jgi:hypothetical protein
MVEGHRGNDAHAQAQRHVLLDDVRIHGRQDDVGGHARLGEGVVDMAAARETLVIGNQRILARSSRRMGECSSSGWPSGTTIRWLQR